jgi:hypothetical protein
MKNPGLGAGIFFARAHAAWTDFGMTASADDIEPI